MSQYNEKSAAPGSTGPVSGSSQDASHAESPSQAVGHSHWEWQRLVWFLAIAAFLIAAVVVFEKCA